MRRRKKVRNRWIKHEKCTVKYCTKGLVGEYYEHDGSSGVRRQYCNVCYALWKWDYRKLKMMAGKELFKIPGPEDMMRYVLRNRKRLTQKPKKKK